MRLIDVLWLEGECVLAAFEVEHSTSIYSGIVRMLDLALGVPGSAAQGLLLVAPDDRENQVGEQLRRPAFRDVARPTSGTCPTANSIDTARRWAALGRA